MPAKNTIKVLIGGKDHHIKVDMRAKNICRVWLLI